MFARSARLLISTRLRASAVVGSRARVIVRTSSKLVVAPALASHFSEKHHSWNIFTVAAIAAGAVATTVTTSTTTACQENTPSSVAKEDLQEVTTEHEDEMSRLPIYTSDEVAKRDGQDGSRIWMTYGGVVYDVTDFIPNHPGGSDQILKASGGVSYMKAILTLMTLILSLLLVSHKSIILIGNRTILALV